MASEPETRTASTTAERMRLVGEWLEYLSGAPGGAKGFIVFQSPTGTYVQFAFDPTNERVRVEVGAFEWHRELGAAIRARAEERLAGRDFSAPDAEHANFWQDIDQFRSRSLSSMTEWAFRDVFAEPADFRLSVGMFDVNAHRPEVLYVYRPQAEADAPAVLEYMCSFGSHPGPWVYDDDPRRFHVCAQSRTCPGCGNFSSRIWHDVRDWQPEGGYLVGVCLRCNEVQREEGSEF